MKTLLRPSVLLYGLLLASVAAALQWFEYQYFIRIFSTESYILCVALLFAGLGIWVGYRLTGQPAGDGFERNDQALEALAITRREYDTLELLAEGESNQGIADRLHISLNTVKTHLAKLYQKLEVTRRTQALQKARSLRLIP